MTIFDEATQLQLAHVSDYIQDIKNVSNKYYRCHVYDLFHLKVKRHRISDIKL